MGKRKSMVNDVSNVRYNHSTNELPTNIINIHLWSPWVRHESDNVHVLGEFLPSITVNFDATCLNGRVTTTLVRPLYHSVVVKTYWVDILTKNFTTFNIFRSSLFNIHNIVITRTYNTVRKRLFRWLSIHKKCAHPVSVDFYLIVT